MSIIKSSPGCSEFVTRCAWNCSSMNECVEYIHDILYTLSFKERYRMLHPHLIDRLSFVVSGIILILSLLLFFTQTGEFISSLAAAILAACLTWISYIIVRWLIMALRK